MRNIDELHCSMHPKLTIFHGINGSGKSTILEAIHMIALGRSFRTRHNKHLIQYDTQQLAVTAKTIEANKFTHTIGLTKSINNLNCVHFDGEPISHLSLLAQHLPLQLLEPQSFELLSGSPENRRHYLDWGVFHVEHAFYDHWRKVQRIIKQRNALLKQNCSYQQIAIWDAELIQHGEILNKMREDYIERLLPQLTQMLHAMIPDAAKLLHLKYMRGWSQQLSLSAALQKHFDHDKATGYTHVGPHRATVQMQYHGHPAHLVLSKGQQKCVVCAMRLAQSIVFDEDHPNTPCLFLIDDLAAELDAQNQTRFADILMKQGNQIFATCITPGQLESFIAGEANHQMFHVEHGSLLSS